MTVIYKDVKTLVESQTLFGQGAKALVMYDTSTGEATGLDVEVLIKLDAEKADTTQVEALDAEKVDKTAVEQVRSQATNKVPSSKLFDDELVQVRSNVGADDNVTIIEFTNNCRFATGTSPIDINSIITTSSWRSAKVECSEGDEFAINGVGGGKAASLWTFVDASGNILSQNATEASIDESLIVVAPQGASYLLINDFNTGKISYKGVPLSASVKALDSQVKEIKEQGYNNLVHFPTLIISTNYQSLLSDANNAKRNCLYTIEMSAIPTNFPSDYSYTETGGGNPIFLKTIANDFNGAEGSIIQEIINSTSGEVVYYRRYSSGAWSDWAKKQSEPIITMYPTYVTTSNIASIVPNADNAADNTIYRIGSRTYPTNFPTNFPSSKAPAIYLETKVVILRGSTIKYQTIYDDSMRSLWVRDYNSGIWSTWRSIQHFISVRKGGTGEGWNYTSLYEALQFAINNDHTFIEVYDGEYDIIAEMGDDFVDGHLGILLGHDMKLKFHPNAYVTAHYNGDSNNLKSTFSAFMTGEGDYEIDGLNLSCSNIRYCIHDDNARAYSEYKHIYRNCRMLMDNSNNTAWDGKQCIGGGLGESAVIVIDNCFFESIGSENNAEVSYHNCGYVTTARSEIHISNCYFKNSTCRFGYYGNTLNMTSCYVNGCRAKQKPYVFRESSGYDNVNMELFEWNNEIVV